MKSDWWEWMASEEREGKDDRGEAMAGIESGERGGKEGMLSMIGGKGRELLPG